jgi:predicted CXXCH cytochrome family protein
VAAILYDNVHEPVSKNMCKQCHQDAGSATPLALQKSGFELCQGCHYEMMNQTFNKNRVHWPLVDQTGCLNCHTPHASSQNDLLKAPMLSLCGSCHADTIARQERSQTKHQPIAEGECSSCHSPHGADNVFILNESSTIELCANCHEWQKHSTHPIGEKVVDPRNPNITLQCLSCHRTHGTEYKNFLYYETTQDLCVQCHAQYRR